LPEVRVTGPLPPDVLPGTSTPSRIDTITRDDIVGPRPFGVPDLLERLPGVTLQNEQGNSFQPDVSIRGFTVSSVTGLPQGLSVFLDGVRLNEPTVEEVNFDLIPLEDVERIEVIRGPSVLFGRNTLGGAISMVTRRGQDVREIVPELAFGSFGRQEYRLRLGGLVKPLDYTVSISEQLEDGYRDFTHSRVSRVRGRIGVDLGDTDVSLSYQFSDNRIKQAGSLPETDLPHDRRANFTAGDFFAPRLHQAIANVQHSATDTITLSANAFVRSLEAEQFNVNLIRANTRLFTDTLSAGGALQLRYTESIVGRPNVLIGGVEYTWNDVRSRTFEETTHGRDLDSDVHDRQDTVGVYVQDSLTVFREPWGKGSSVILTAAARWDWVRHDIEDRLERENSAVHHFERASPRAGVNVNVSERLGLYGTYAEGFRAPAFLELTCAGPGAICPGLQAGVAPDPPLKAVKARSYEVGMTARPRTWLDTDVSLFRIDLTDDIFAVSPTGTTGLFFQNIGSTRREGIELAMRARAGRIIDGFLNYTYTRATFQDTAEISTARSGTEIVHPGDSFSLVPKHRVNAGISYHPWPWATVSVDGRYVSSQFLRGDETNSDRPLSSYVVVNAGVGVKVGKLEAFARVNNVLNNKYETFGTYAPDARQAGTPVVRFETPAAPINFVVGAQYAF
jgi:outer membrane receptor protein involved in Fe transport